jgi:hypothetical protein
MNGVVVDSGDDLRLGALRFTIQWTTGLHVGVRDNGFDGGAESARSILPQPASRPSSSSQLVFVQRAE